MELKLRELLRQKQSWFILLISFCIFYFPLFYNLDGLVLRMWDESRNAVNATEMLANKNIIIRHYDGSPDMWEVKPPLLTWLQSIGIKLFGYNELAIRLPSAVATLVMLFTFIFFSGKELNSIYIGIISSLILITSPGYIGWHVSRTGDHDAVVIMFMMISFLAYFKFLQIPPGKKANNIFFIVCLSMIFGYLTKSIISLVFLPGMFLYTLFSKNLRRVLSSKVFYISLILFFIVVGGYYVTREIFNHGYLKEVWSGELFPRYINAEQNFWDEPFLYYINNMFSGRFIPWIYICLPAILLQWFFIPKNNRAFTIYVTCTLILFLLFISAGSNNIWYDAPAYPLMAIITGQFYYYFLIQLLDKIIARKYFRNAILVLVVLLSFYVPYRKIIKTNSMNLDYSYNFPKYSICYLLREYQNGKMEIPLPLLIVHESYNAHIKFYINSLKATKNIEEIKFAKREEIMPGKFILISEQKIHEYIESEFTSKIISEYADAKILHITQRKSDQEVN